MLKTKRDKIIRGLVPGCAAIIALLILLNLTPGNQDAIADEYETETTTVTAIPENATNNPTTAIRRANTIPRAETTAVASEYDESGGLGELYEFNEADEFENAPPVVEVVLAPVEIPCERVAAILEEHDVQVVENPPQVQTMEREPPDPTLDDTERSIGYSAVRGNTIRTGMLGAGSRTNSWHVWDVNWQRISSESHYRSSVPNPVNHYNPTTGIYTEYVILSDTHIQENRYSYQFNRISFRAEALNVAVSMTPDTRNPTAFTRNHQTFMKSGYGVNISASPGVRVTTTHESTGVSHTAVHLGRSESLSVVAPQIVFTYFPEFNYSSFDRQLERINNRFVFRQNRFSTFNSRAHYTPWWFPDGSDYELVVRSDFGYTPAGRIVVYETSNAIRVEGNLIDDWRVVKSK